MKDRVRNFYLKTVRKLQCYKIEDSICKNKAIFAANICKIVFENSTLFMSHDFRLRNVYLGL